MNIGELKTAVSRALAADLNAPHWQLLYRRIDLQWLVHNRYDHRTIPAAFVLECLSAIQSDLDAIGWLLQRLFTQQQGHVIGDQFAQNMHYILLDIEMFHIKMLLIMDCIGQAFAYTSTSLFTGEKKINELGFGQIRNQWRQGTRTKSGVSPESFDRLFNCEWLDELGEMRNIIVHRPSFALALPDVHRVTYHVWERGMPYMKPRFWQLYPQLLCNDNAAYFDSYAGVYLCQMLNHLQDVAPELLGWFGQTDFPPTNGESIPLRMIRKCLEQTLADINELNS